MTSETLSLFPSPVCSIPPKSCLRQAEDVHARRNTPSPVVSSKLFTSGKLRGLAVQLTSEVDKPVTAQSSGAAAKPSFSSHVSSSSSDHRVMDTGRSPEATRVTKKKPAVAIRKISIDTTSSETLSNFSGSTLARSNSTASAEPKLVSPPIKSMFPEYDPTLPLSQQRYYPTDNVPRPSHERRTNCQHHALTNLPSPESPTSAAGLSQLQALWNAASGQNALFQSEKVKLAMHRDEIGVGSNATEVRFGSREGRTFYSISPSDASSELSVRRHHPARTGIVPIAQLDVSALQTGAKCETTIFPQQAAFAALEAAAITHRANAIARYDPRASSPQAAQLAFDAVAEAKANESCQLVRMSEGAREYQYDLRHPRAGDFIIYVEGTFDLSKKSNARITLQQSINAEESMAKAAKLVCLDLDTETLEVDLGLFRKLQSKYMIDNAICAVLAVAFTESKLAEDKTKAETFAAPPNMSYKETGGAKQEKGSRWRRSKKGKKQDGNDEKEKLPGLTRGILYLLGFSFEAIASTAERRAPPRIADAMSGEDPYKKYAHLPIPSYEEATSSRPSSSNTNNETSDETERQGLLGRQQHQAARNGPYRPPTAESSRPSEDSDLYLPEVNGEDDDDEEAAVRRDMEEMEILEPDSVTGRRRGQFLGKLSHTWSSLPSFRRFSMPSFASLRQRLPTIPEEFRLSLPVIARLFGLFTIAALIYILFALDIIPNAGHMAQHYDPESVRARVQEQASLSPSRISEYLEYITSYDHVAGTEGDFYLAEWVQTNWQAQNLDDVRMHEYFVYMNYPEPGGRNVEIVSPPDRKWTALLEEESVFKDSGREKQQTLNWHGYSKQGNVTGHLVYANGGSREDFKRLKDMGVELDGAIALVRYYHTEADRGMKVKAAEMAGAAGCLIYSDPKEDGFLKGAVMPDGPWRPRDSVQRGSVALSSLVVGDPLTPGYASTKDAKLIGDINGNITGLPQIPSLPLAWRDAQHLLMALKGHGQKVPSDWEGGVPDVEWWTGDKGSPEIRLVNENSVNAKQQIWNVHGLVQGMETPGKKLIVGSHRDAWCFGSVDAGSSQAVLMEVVTIFGDLIKLGWRPLRSIEFVSWDAEEYNFVGSTEFVEDNMDYLRKNGVGYLNVDVGVSGSEFRVAGSPVYKKALMHVLDRVSDPYKNVTLRQLFDERNEKIEGLGAGSDYVPFQDMAGTSSLDFGFEGEENGYPYHSCYETFEWMTKYGDPDFQYHKTLATVWALLILEIADRPIIPFDLNDYAAALSPIIDELEKDAAATAKDLKTDIAKTPFSVQPLREAVDAFVAKAKEFHEFDDMWATKVLAGSGGFESNADALRRIEHNSRVIDFETNLLDLPTTGEEGPYGVPGREQYKHVIFGPQLWDGYAAAYFPAVRDALQEGRWEDAQKQLERAARILRVAANKLTA
ncbi:glutamate carboxypeptidase 2 [Aureobasidium subglaciale]|nr:glutamate carboxypeptidase 2 [Aureobasidium subglaciale]